MRIGLQLPRFIWEGGADALAGTLKQIAQTADEGGFASLWVMDHWFQIPQVGAHTEAMPESYSTLAHMAAYTRRVKLGALVTGATYRHPGLLVKTAATLDVLSGGRAVFGVGAAWYEREHHGLGVPFPHISERFARLEETLQIAKQMWSDDNGEFRGRYFHLQETLCAPQPLQRPHPPILIGGMGERKTLRLAAEYADACNLFAHAGAAELRRKLDVLAEHCDTLDRDYDEIERTCLGTVQLGPEYSSIADVIRHCRELAEAGIQHAIFNLPDVEKLDALERLAKDVIPEVGGF